MDTSPEYIKMCDCPEIQGKWQYRRGDWHAFREGDEWMTCCDTADNFIGFEGSCGAVWLPRQDQLQEMVEALCGTWEALLVELSSWHSPWGALHNEYASSFKSFEQAWLAFVMHEKHNKHWNGEEWV